MLIFKKLRAVMRLTNLKNLINLFKPPFLMLLI
jgi:hypothetical protein